MNDRYEIQGIIAEGGLGAVHRAWDRNLSREVAIKRVRAASGDDARRKTDGLLREARTLSTLQHPNIVTVYDAGEDDEGAFIVMELVKGETLEEIIERGALTEVDFEQLATQALEGLIAAHALDLVHLDLKPQNVMITWHASGRFQVKILDFGLAQIAEHPSAQAVDESGAVMGSVFFMAPEQFERAPVDQRTDLYVLGGIFYHALTQQYPFQGETGPQVMTAHLRHKFIPLAQFRPDLSPFVCQWVEWLFNRKPADRPANAAAALAAFKARALPKSEVPVAVAVVEEPARPVVKVAASASAPKTKAPPYVAPLPKPLPARRQGMPKWAWVTLPLLVVLVIGFGIVRFIQARGETARSERFAELVSAEKPQGTDVDVRLLLEYLESPKSSAAAAHALSKLQGGDYINDILTAHFDQAKSREARGNLAKVLGLRGATAAYPKLLRMVEDKNSDLRRAAWTGLGMITPAAELPGLIEKMQSVSAADLPFAESAIVSAATEGAEPDARIAAVVSAFRSGQGADAQRAALLRIIGGIRGPQAFELLTQSLADANPELRKAAAAALGQWGGTEALPPLAARFPAEQDPACRLILLAAVGSLVAQPGPLPQSELAARIKALHESARDAREKAEALAAMSRVIDPAAIELFDSLGVAEPARQASYAATSKGIRAVLEKAIAVGDEAVLAADRADYARTGGLGVRAGILSNWLSESDWASWLIHFNKPGVYELSVTQASAGEKEGKYEVSLAADKLTTSAVRTGDANAFKSFIIGKAKVGQPGIFKLWLRPTEIPEGEALFRLKSVELKRLGD